MELSAWLAERQARRDAKNSERAARGLRPMTTNGDIAKRKRQRDAFARSRCDACGGIYPACGCSNHNG